MKKIASTASELEETNLFAWNSPKAQCVQAQTMAGIIKLQNRLSSLL